MKTLAKEDWLKFVDALIAKGTHEVCGVVAKGHKFVYAPLESAKELRLDFDVTVLPPKKYLLPPHEALLTYSLVDGRAKMVKDDKPRIVVGMHPYDVHAIVQMDKVYLADNIDDSYKTRRDATLIIASDIISVSPRSFAASMGTDTVSEGFDLLVTDLGDRVVVREGTPAGSKLMAGVKASESTEGDLRAVESVRAKVKESYKAKPGTPKEGWNALMESGYRSPVWEENAKKCLECGSCTLVCPTCYCYDVEDVTAPDMKGGKRVRTWDGCLLKEFTLVGSSEIFRAKDKDRYRHRFLRKGKYIPDRYGFVACVGCGRCATACLPDIADPVNLVNALMSAPKTEMTPLPRLKRSAPKQDAPLLMPRPATIVKKDHMTALETHYTLRFDDGKRLDFKPGQFVEVSVYGAGEAPFGLASAPGKDTFEIVAREVGHVTKRMREHKEGEKFGIRGPLGNGFDLDAMKGKNIIFVCGGTGMFPMRALINTVLQRRSDFKELWVMNGCKEPGALLFADQIAEWKARKDVHVMCTVDKCPEGVCWDGDIGLITTLIPKIDFDPKETLAVIIGPPIMYGFVIKELAKKGMEPDHVLVSLERRMKCGVGKCGHCQINGVYCCVEGPVFNYAEIKDLPEAFHLGY